VNQGLGCRVWALRVFSLPACLKHGVRSPCVFPSLFLPPPPLLAHAAKALCHVIMSSCHHVIMSSCHHVIMSCFSEMVSLLVCREVGLVFVVWSVLFLCLAPFPPPSEFSSCTAFQFTVFGFKSPPPPPPLPTPPPPPPSPPSTAQIIYKLDRILTPNVLAIPLAPAHDLD
jgi:hypothetical protein